MNAGLREDRLEHAAEAAVARGRQPLEHVDECPLTLEGVRHDDELDQHEVGRADPRHQHSGFGPQAGEQQQATDDGEPRRDVLAHRQREDDEDGGQDVPARVQRVQGHPQKERPERQVVKVVEARAVQWRIAEVGRRDQRRRGGPDVPPREQEQRQRAQRHQHRLQDEQRLGVLVERVRQREHESDGREVVAEVGGGRAAERGRLEQRPRQVQRVPDQVLFQAEIEAHRVQSPVGAHRLVREERGVPRHPPEQDHPREHAPDARQGRFQARDQPPPAEALPERRLPHRRRRQRDAHQRLQPEHDQRRHRQERQLAVDPEPPLKQRWHHAEDDQRRASPGDAVDPIDAGRGSLAPPRPEQDRRTPPGTRTAPRPPCCRAGTSGRACRDRCSRRRAAACRARAGSRTRARPTVLRGTTCRTRARRGRGESSRCRAPARTRAAVAARAARTPDRLGRRDRLGLRIAARLRRHDLQRRDRGDFGSRGIGRRRWGWRQWIVRQVGFLARRRPRGRQRLHTLATSPRRWQTRPRVRPNMTPCREPRRLGRWSARKSAVARRFRGNASCYAIRYEDADRRCADRMERQLGCSELRRHAGWTGGRRRCGWRHWRRCWRRSRRHGGRDRKGGVGGGEPAGHGGGGAVGGSGTGGGGVRWRASPPVTAVVARSAAAAAKRGVVTAPRAVERQASVVRAAAVVAGPAGTFASRRSRAAEAIVAWARSSSLSHRRRRGRRARLRRHRWPRRRFAISNSLHAAPGGVRRRSLVRLRPSCGFLLHLQLQRRRAEADLLWRVRNVRRRDHLRQLISRLCERTDRRALTSACRLGTLRP